MSKFQVEMNAYRVDPPPSQFWNFASPSKIATLRHCSCYGHRDRDHSQPDRYVRTVSIHPVNVKSVSIQTKKCKDTDKPKSHNKYTQAETVDMNEYSSNMANFKRIQSELFGQKKGNDIYKAQLKSCMKTIKLLERDVAEYKANNDRYFSQINASQQRIDDLQSQNNEYSKLIKDLTRKLEDQHQQLCAYQDKIKNYMKTVPVPKTVSTLGYIEFLGIDKQFNTIPSAQCKSRPDVPPQQNLISRY
ncbi:unnamed protein product [Owenia fusiformis]|uniref:Uncharacterized protein n=1 Tax=Owenia fusiformis TaxID=6347 RepID=A0A8J1YAB7_OWEFU|nr:unnamed protein product [Owenia fusiformis]